MKEASIQGYLVDETVDIKRDYQTQDVVVVQKGKEIFRKPATKQNIDLAHLIYIGAKYIDDKENKNGR